MEIPAIVAGVAATGAAIVGSVAVMVHKATEIREDALRWRSGRSCGATANPPPTLQRLTERAGIRLPRPY